LAHSELHFSSLNRVLDQRAELLHILEERQQQQLAALQAEQQQLAALQEQQQQQQRQQQQQQQLGADWSQVTPPLELVEQLVSNLKREHLLKVRLLQCNKMFGLL
jgi:uncharacterized protein YbcC (UPF0753/DUF2309 family)